VNGGLSSIPSPTMPNFGLAPGSANGQNGPAGQDPASVYNGLAQAYPSREFLPLGKSTAEPDTIEEFDEPHPPPHTHPILFNLIHFDVKSNFI